jgi:LysM repeat protein
MAFLMWRDLTSSRELRLPTLPVDGSFTVERPQTLLETPLIAGKPIVQIGAPGAARLTLPLELWGALGDKAWTENIVPAFGGPGSGYTPHLVQVAWGNSSDDAFTGRPVGQPPTLYRMGADDGEIFSRALEIVLVEVSASRTTLLNRAGQKVNAPSITHIVKQGETLYTIARFYQGKGVKTTVERIALANGGNPPIRPRPGSRLVIPK